MFLMVDGIDGSGKSTILEAWKEYLTSQGNAIFDLKSYWLEKNQYPDLSEIRSYDFVFSCEQTRTGIGKVISEELISQKNSYPMQAIAEAYSLDRLVLYTKIIIPLLQDKKMVIQDRGFSTSLAYQTVELDFDEVANLPGNKLALQYPPNYLILAECSPETCAARLASRSEKNDNAIFERLERLKKNANQFKTEKYKKTLEQCGTKIINLNTEDNIGIIKDKAINLLKKILNNKI